MKAYKFRVYPTKAQEQELNKHLWVAKNLWNDDIEKMTANRLVDLISESNASGDYPIGLSVREEARTLWGWG